MPTITFKVSPEEAASIRRLARRAGCSVSELLRRRALGSARTSRRRVRGYTIRTSRKTGLPVMHGPRGARKVTPEEIANLLADFP